MDDAPEYKAVGERKTGGFFDKAGRVEWQVCMNVEGVVCKDSPFFDAISGLAGQRFGVSGGLAVAPAYQQRCL